jgi:hypothetical protein
LAIEAPGSVPRVIAPGWLWRREPIRRVLSLQRVGVSLRPSHDVRGKERSMDPHERPVVTEDNKTAMRAGSTGNNVRYVLIGSVALAIVAWILVEYLVRP